MSLVIRPRVIGFAMTARISLIRPWRRRRSGHRLYYMTIARIQGFAACFSVCTDDGAAIRQPSSVVLGCW